MARRILTNLLLAASLGLALAGTARAEGISVKLDGALLDATPVMMDGRVMVPLRSVFEGLGAKVRFDAATSLIQAEGSKHSIELKLGETKAWVDGRDVVLEAPARSVDGKTMVPLRFVAEAFGAKVRWNAQTKTVEIESTPAFAIQPVDEFDPREDLRRLACGNQAAVLKVFDDERKSVVFFKGLDDRLQARLTLTEREGIREACGIPADRVGQAVDQLLGGYQELPRRECLALLGVLAHQEWVGEEGMVRVRTFLAERMHNDPHVKARRMATLALALVSHVDSATVEEVLRFYSSRENLWETFPVQQFFEYHAEAIRSMPGLETVVQRVATVHSLYTPNILEYLQ